MQSSFLTSDINGKTSLLLQLIYFLPFFYRKKGAKCLDDWPWIFKDFQKNGYATMFNEDEVDLGAFTYRLMGFCNPSMGHYLLQYWYAGISEIAPWFKVSLGSMKSHCIGSQAIHNVSLEMLRSVP